MQVKVMTTTIVYGQVDAAATSMTIGIFTTAPNIYIMKIFARVKTAFAGVTGPTVKLGTPTSTDIYIEKQSIALVGDLNTRQTLAYTLLSSGLNQSLLHPVHCLGEINYQKAPANISVDATFESSATDLSSLSAGEIEFVMVYCE